MDIRNIYTESAEQEQWGLLQQFTYTENIKRFLSGKGVSPIDIKMQKEDEMRVQKYLMVMAIVLLISPYAFAQGNDHHGHEGSMIEHMKPGESTAVEAGNKVCPVSGQKVGEMALRLRLSIREKSTIYAVRDVLKYLRRTRISM